MPDSTGNEQDVLEELTAYLDGELDAAARERVEERLARDADFRRELQRLERCWDALDRLPRSAVDDAFTQTTMEMVAVAAEEDSEALEAERPRARRRLWLLAICGAAAAAVAGFTLGGQLWPDPNEELLRDLPVLENFDLYHHADSVEFLRLLEKENLFAPDEAAATTESEIRSPKSDLRSRREWVLKMTPVEQQELLRKQERFRALPSEEQDRLRKLQADLERDPQAARFRQVLESYHQWLKSLSPGQRAELLELKPHERVAQVKQIQQLAAKSRPRSPDGQVLTDEDLRRIALWLEDFIWQHKERVLADIPQSRREQFDKMDEPMRRRAMLLVAVQRWSSAGFSDLSPASEDVQRLLKQLSPAAQQRLSRAESQQDKRNLLKDWVQLAVQHRWEQAGASRMIPPVAAEEMERFFAKELSNEERERLLAMPRDQMQRELRRLYFQDPGRGGRGFPRPAFPGEMGPPRRPFNSPRPGEAPPPQRPFKPGRPEGQGDKVRG